MDNLLTKISETAAYLTNQGITGADTAIVLGTGLGAFIEQVEVLQTIPYKEIPNFPVATVEFHKGQLLLARAGNKRVIILQGRFHYYEGYSMQQVTFPVRVLKALNIHNLLLSNAAGGMNPSYKKGDLVLLTDHINMQPENPLRGVHDPSFGDRFPDMSQPYHPVLNQLVLEKATQLNIPLYQGVYVAVQGPNLETRAEYRYLRLSSADMVGMSTVPEVIVANQCGIRCVAVSVITDECDPDHLQPVNIEEIIKVAGEADKVLSVLFREVVVNMQ